MSRKASNAGDLVQRSTPPPSSPIIYTSLNSSRSNGNLNALTSSQATAANNSFSNLNVLNESMLYVNVKELNLRVYNEIVVSWNIVEDETSVADFIGVYRLSSTDSDDSLDSHKLNGSKIGHLTWSLNKLKQLNLVNSHPTKAPPAPSSDLIISSPLANNSNQSPLLLDCSVELVEFRYYSGQSPDSRVLAKSVQLKLIYLNSQASQACKEAAALPRNLLELRMTQKPSEYFKFRIHDLKAAQLRKGMFFNPDPYVKVAVISCQLTPNSPKCHMMSPEYTTNSSPTTREFKTFSTINTCFPHWKNASFEIIAHENDKLLIEVKDKFAKTKPTMNRFLGRVQVDMKKILEKTQLTKGKHHFTYGLSKRTGSDNVTGSFSFSITLITGEIHTHANKINSNPVDSPVLLNRSEHHNSSVNQSPSTSLQLSSPTSQPSSQSKSNKMNSSSTYNSNTTPKNTTKTLSSSAAAGTNEEQISTNTSLISDPSKCSILNSKAHTSMPCFSNHIRGSDSKTNRNANIPGKPLADHNNDENNFASPSMTSSASASASSTCSEETSQSELEPSHQCQITSSSSSSSSSSASSFRDNANQINQVRSSSVSSNSSSGPQVSSSSTSASNSTETVNQPVDTLTTLLGETTLNESSTQQQQQQQPGTSRQKMASAYRSKSLEKIKYSKQQTTPTSSPNSSFQTKPNIYLKNRKPRYGLSQSNPAMSNATDVNKSFSGTKTPRANLYLKRSQLTSNRQSRSVTSSSNNSLYELLYGADCNGVKSRSKSESNLTCLIRRSNQQRMAEINLSESLNNREIMELIKPDLNSIVATLNESRQKNVAYEQIRFQVQREFNETVLKKIQQHKQTLRLRNSLKLKPQQGSGMIRSSSRRSTPIITETTSNLLAFSINSNAMQVQGSTALTSKSQENVDAGVSNINTTTNTEGQTTNNQTNDNNVTSLDDADESNFQNGVILVVENSSGKGTSNANNQVVNGMCTDLSTSAAPIASEASTSSIEQASTSTQQQSSALISHCNVNGDASNSSTAALTTPTSSGNSQSVNELPEYWEARTDNLGRVFYIDHLNRTTTWKRPKFSSKQSTLQDRMMSSEIEKQRLDKRYQSIRRTINQKDSSNASGSSGGSSTPCSTSGRVATRGQPAVADDATESTVAVSKASTSKSSGSRPSLVQASSLSSESDDSVPIAEGSVSTKQHSSQPDMGTTSTQPRSANESTPTASASASTSSAQPASTGLSSEVLLKQPGAVFILRSDLQQLVKLNGEASSFLKQNNSLYLILQKIRANPTVYYKKYQHNKELVRFLNMFTDVSQPLPEGWEMKYEKSSKIFFVDHSSRSTTYIDPRLPLSSSSSSCSRSKQSNLTTSESIQEIPTASSATTAATAPAEDTTISNSPSTSSNLSSASSAQQQQSSKKAKPSSKHAPQRPQPPPPPPSFPPPPPPALPPNLPPPLARQQPSTSTSHATTPPLTVPTAPAPTAPSTSSSSPSQSSSTNLSYSDRVVAFLQQPNIVEILKKNNILLSAKQKDKLAMVRHAGRSVYDRMCADMDLASIVSQLEELIMCFVVPASTTASATRNNQTPTAAAQTQAPTTSATSTNPVIPQVTKPNNIRRGYERGFHVKLRNFYRKLEAKGYCQGPIKSKIVIRREKLLEDAKVKFMQLSKQDLRKNKINICFHGEEGLDYGGPAREFFFLLSRELFNPYYGLFEYSASDMYTVQISPMSAFQEHAIEWFQFAGRVLGIALIHQYLLDAFFTRPFYKALLRDTNWTLSDLETLDPEYCQSLIWIKENDITDVLDLTFSVTEDKCGELIERDLKENGRNIPVTEKNKNEYLNKLIKWRVERGVQKQTDALVKGFYEVIDQKQVQTFDARELELVLCGTIEIDLNDWKKYTDYRSGYHQQHQVIVWFWQAVDKFDNEQKLKLLQFVTGTSSIPYEGFSALRGSNGPRKFCIERWGTSDALPRAHTCFNRLDLPPYASFETLYEKILLAIEETSGFSIQ